MIPNGPHPISPKRQVTLPAEVMRAVGLDTGDQVFFEVLADKKGCVLVVPARLAEKWWQEGKAGH